MATKTPNRSREVVLSGTINITILSWIFIMTIIPLLIYLFSDNEIIQAEFERLPIMVILFVTGSPFILYVILANVGYLTKGRYLLHLKISFAALVAYMWVLIFYAGFTFAGFAIVGINLFFIPLYVEAWYIWNKERNQLKPMDDNKQKNKSDTSKQQLSVSK